MKYYLKLLLLPGFFLLSSLLSILISITPATNELPAHIWAFSFNDWTIFVGNASLVTAKQLFFHRSRQCQLFIFFLILTTSVQSICHVLRQCRIPALFVELVELTYRFIFIFFRQYAKKFILLSRHDLVIIHLPSGYALYLCLLLHYLLKCSNEAANLIMPCKHEVAKWSIGRRMQPIA